MTSDSQLDILLQRSRANEAIIAEQVRKASPSQRRQMMTHVLAALEALPADKKRLAEEAIRREMERKGVTAHVSLGSGKTSGWAGALSAGLTAIAQIGVSIYAMEHERKMTSRRDRSEAERLRQEMSAYEARMEQDRAALRARAQEQESASTLPGGINQQTLLIGGGVLLAAVVLLKR